MELTDEQISKLTPEQISQFDDDPEALEKYLAEQEKGETKTKSEDNPESEDEDGEANDAGEDEDQDEDKPVVLTKNGKGTIPYEKHKELRVENATLREQLQQLQQSQAELETLRKKVSEAKTPAKRGELQERLTQRIAKMKEEFPEIGDSLDSVKDLISDISADIEAEKAQRRAEKEAAKAKAEADAEAQKKAINEQVQEAKENNPYLLHWEKEDGDEWQEAMRQDQALLMDPKWQKKSYEERFAEVVKRVRTLMPEASEPPNSAPSAKTREKAKAQLDKAAERKPTTLSDIKGGANPDSENEKIDNLSPHQLAKRLLNMPKQDAAAMRARLD